MINSDSPQITQKVVRLLNRHADELSEGGLPELVRKSFICLLLPLALMIVIVVRVLRPIVLIRFGHLMSSKIGYVGHTDTYLCERDAGLHGSRTYDIFYHVYNYRSFRDKNKAANNQLKKMWDRALPVYRFAALLDFVNRRLPGWQKHKIPMRQGLGDRDLSGVFDGAKSHLSFTSQEERFGQSELERLGIPEGTPFVCFNARDSAYGTALFSHVKNFDQKYRDHDIHDYLPAVEKLVDRGYYALRMGAIVNESLRTSNPMIIDYASKFRTEFLDIYLASKCRFFLSCSSGIDVVASAFRRPVVAVNLAPVERATTWDSTHLFIPKKLWLKDEGRLMPFREIFESGAGDLLRQEDYDQRGIETIDTTPEDIVDVALEMDDRLLGTWHSTEEDEKLQRRFWQLFKATKISKVFVSRISTSYLRKNKDLLE